LISISLKWKTLAAKVASALVSLKQSIKCCMFPAPPEAIIGMFTNLFNWANASLAKPFFVPSLSIDVNKISPAPLCSTSFAQSNKSNLVATFPPTKCTFHFPPICLASIATTMHCEPNFSANWLIKFGFFTADELIETLSAPDFNNKSTSSTDEIPPPTVNGIFTCWATRSTKFNKVLRFSSVAEISKKINSSAPSLA
jgi:hypothetical protein